jgi:hypothetical protein
MARKGDLRPYKNLNMWLDQEMCEALERAAIQSERRLTQEARYRIKLGLKMGEAPAEASADASA